MSSVCLKNVSKRYGSLYAVRDLDLEIKEGEFFSLLGPSGCGKTTTLRMIAGFETPDSGQICFGERDVTFIKPNLRNTGMVFQNYALFPHMTVFENVAFGLRARRVEKQTIKARVAEALRLVDLEGFEKRQVTELSGGQQQRVALARALVIEPGILLLDEPLSNLDAKLREETRYEIRKLQRRLGITTIYVTHDQEEALTISDRIAVMNEGLCQQVGSPVDIYERPTTTFVAAFVGKANVLRGTIGSVLDGGVAVEVTPDFVIQLDSQAVLETASGQERELAIRAEHIEVVPEAIDEANSFPARIERIDYSGALVEYEVLVDRQRLRVRRLGEQHLSSLAYGDRVYVHIPPNRIRILQ